MISKFQRIILSTQPNTYYGINQLKLSHSMAYQLRTSSACGLKAAQQIHELHLGSHACEHLVFMHIPTVPVVGMGKEGGTVIGPWGYLNRKLPFI